ncbi:hypothetical protein ACWCYZ_05675 [Streptomyces virginiae]
MLAARGNRRARREHAQALRAMAKRRAAVPAERCGSLVPLFFGDRWLECVLHPGHQGSHADEEGARWSETPAPPTPDSQEPNP